MGMMDLLSMVFVEVEAGGIFKEFEVEYVNFKELGRLSISLETFQTMNSSGEIGYKLSIESHSGFFLTEVVAFRAGETKSTQIVPELKKVIEGQLESLWKAAYQTALAFEKDPNQSLVIRMSDYVGLENALKTLGKEIVGR